MKHKIEVLAIYLRIRGTDFAYTDTKNERRANFSKFRQIPKTPGTGNRESEDIHSVTRSSWIWDWVQFHSE